jgi:hypothetical protein
VPASIIISSAAFINPPGVVIMSCPGCGSKLWDGARCGACGRLASDASLRGGEQRSSRAARVGLATIKGIAAGAILGYLGGGPLNLSAIENGIWIGAAVGAVVGIVAVSLLARINWREAGLALWLIPGLAAAGALVIGFKKLARWAFGWAVAQAGEQYVAAGLGALLGGLIAGLIAYWASRDRHVPSTSATTRDA